MSEIIEQASAGAEDILLPEGWTEDEDLFAADAPEENGDEALPPAEEGRGSRPPWRRRQARRPPRRPPPGGARAVRPDLPPGSDTPRIP